MTIRIQGGNFSNSKEIYNLKMRSRDASLHLENQRALKYREPAGQGRWVLPSEPETTRQENTAKPSSLNAVSFKVMTCLSVA